MFTLLRLFRIWKLKIKWELALWQYADRQLMEVINNPEQIKEKIEKVFIGTVAEILHNEHKRDPDAEAAAEVKMDISTN